MPGPCALGALQRRFVEAEKKPLPDTIAHNGSHASPAAPMGSASFKLRHYPPMNLAFGAALRG